MFGPQRPTVVLIYGAVGSRKENLLQSLMDSQQQLLEKTSSATSSIHRMLDGLEKFVFVPTVTVAPKDIEHDFKRTPNCFEFEDASNFASRFASNDFDLCWKEFLDKQYECSKSEAITIDYIYKAIPNVETILKEHPSCRKVIISTSNSSGSEESGSVFNPLMEAIKLYKDSHDVKIVLVRASREVVQQSLKDKGCYNQDEIDTLMVHHEYIEKDKTINDLRKYLHYNGNIPLTFVDITNNMEADMRRFVNAVEGKTEEENEPFYESKHTAREYMKTHKVSELLQYLLQLVLVEMPSDPRQFLIDNLKKIQSHSSKKILTSSDFETMFSMIDINNKGFVTYDQTLKTLINLKVDSKNAEKALSAFEKTSRINQGQFVEIISKQLDILNGTPYQ
ncbi:hypothetical protein C9374_013690 [Naegleria lovaniensis]|uniref:EF-hand domain-containing protein n=1 Tax=Naegleria lovaniensis TaxID=51637 RepID=A0AA88G9D1_NAELO|nr:uncharacterized protein C9374_013690 [Naegleria lovaniensis]KAG2372626.1 hypothetical protein C9374_013690 [Naegleria lovaniensis]